MTQITIDAKQFQRAAKALEKANFGPIAGLVIGQTLVKGANAVRRNVRAAARPHRRTGKMASKVRYRREGVGIDSRVTVKAASPIAHLVARGAKPHDIVPKSGGRGMTIRGRQAGNSALTGAGSRAVQSAGADVFAVRRRVHHPGYQPPSNFWDDGLRAAEPEIAAALQLGAETMATKLAAKMKAR